MAATMQARVSGVSFRKVEDGEPTAVIVFKTMSDPFSGRISFFKVVSGVVKNDATLENYTRRGQERFAHLSIMQGRKAVEVAELHAGDIGRDSQIARDADRRHAGSERRGHSDRTGPAARSSDDLRHRAEEPRR